MKKLLATLICLTPFAVIAEPNTTEISAGYTTNLGDGDYKSGGSTVNFDYDEMSLAVSHSFDYIAPNLYPTVTLTSLDADLKVGTVEFNGVGLIELDLGLTYGDLKDGVGSDFTMTVTRDDNSDSYWEATYDMGLGDGYELGFGYGQDFSAEDISKQKSYSVSLEKSIDDGLSVELKLARVDVDYTDGDSAELDLIGLALIKSF